MPSATSSRTETLADDLLGAVGRLTRWASRNADLAIPTAALRLLALLDELGPTRIGDLARADNISQPTLTVQVDRLERAGLVARRSDPQDSRAVRVRITPTGRTSLAEARSARAAALAPLIEAASPEQRARLRAAADVLASLVADLPTTS